LYDAFGQRQVSDDVYGIESISRSDGSGPRFWQSPETLKDIYVRSASGNPVPLSTFAHFEATTTTLSVNHQGQFPAITISFNLAPGVALGDAVAIIDKAKQDMLCPQQFRRISGNGSGISGIAGQRANADTGRADNCLYRAGNIV